MNEEGRVLVWVLWFVAAAGVGFGALVGIGCAVGANACPFREAKPFTTTVGSEIWVARCALCHGVDGAGGEGPSLVSGPAARLTQDELEAKIARGKPLAGMPAFKRELSQEQIDAVARYVLELREAS